MIRKGKGRKKIAIKKIEDETHLQVTYSKRRSGVFKKASELSILCEAEVAVIIFSPGNKVYSFGHRSVFSTVNKYLNSIGNNHYIFHDNTLGVSQNTNYEELNKKVTNLDDSLAVEKVRRKQLIDLQNVNEGLYWWDDPGKDKLTLNQLELLKAMMEELYNDIQMVKQKINYAANINAGNVIAPSISPFNDPRYVQGQNVEPFYPRAPVYYTSDGIQYHHRMTNQFHPNLLNRSRHNDGAGPSGTKP